MIHKKRTKAFRVAAKNVIGSTMPIQIETKEKEDSINKQEKIVQKPFFGATTDYSKIVAAVPTKQASTSVLTKPTEIPKEDAIQNMPPSQTSEQGTTVKISNKDTKLQVLKENSTSTQVIKRLTPLPETGEKKPALVVPPLPESKIREDFFTKAAIETNIIDQQKEAIKEAVVMEELQEIADELEFGANTTAITLDIGSEQLLQTAGIFKNITTLFENEIQEIMDFTKDYKK